VLQESLHVIDDNAAFAITVSSSKSARSESSPSPSVTVSSFHPIASQLHDVHTVDVGLRSEAMDMEDNENDLSQPRALATSIDPNAVGTIMTNNNDGSTSQQGAPAA
jgi:hypothetical protein